MSAAWINPFLRSTTHVFQTMLNVALDCDPPFTRKSFAPQFEVTGMIGLTGSATGTAAVSLSREMALLITEKLLCERPAEMNAQVVDAIGELTNVIVGSAKAELADWRLSLGLPTVVAGRNLSIAFPSRATPISIPFRSEIGAIIVEVGIVSGSVSSLSGAVELQGQTS